MAFNHLRNEIKTELINPMELSETYAATASIQLRTHPTHATINFSEMGKKLLESARNGDTDDVLELINTGAPFTTDWLGASPLHYAAQYGHVETVETLLRSGIAKDARTKIDRTALHVACQEGFLETVQILVNYGCDVDAKDMLKMTPLHWAVQRGHRDIMEVLLNHGADVKIVNKFDKTPIDIAYSTGHSDYVPLLQNFKPKAKPIKINPVESTVPIRLMKTHPKSRSKTPNMNRSLPNRLPANIKQEMDDDTDIRPTTTTVDYKIIKRESMPNGQLLQFSGKTGQTEKLVINSFKDQQNTSPMSNSNNSNNQNINNNMNNMSNKKIYTINPQSSNIVVVSNSTGSTKSEGQGNGQIKVMSKKQVFTEIKNKNQTFHQVDNLNFPFGFTKQNPPQVIKRFVIQNPNQSTSAKDEEIKKLTDENNKLKRELEEYKSLIISKDLEIERLKKPKINITTTTSNNNNNTSTANNDNNENNTIHHDDDDDEDEDD